MKYAELTESLKDKFRRIPVCKICGNELTQVDDFQYIVVKIGRRSYTSFMHTACLATPRKRMADAELTREGYKNGR